MLAWWPCALVDPILNPIRPSLHFARCSRDIPTLFFGRYAGSNDQPLAYLPVDLAVERPDLAAAARHARVDPGKRRPACRQLWTNQPAERDPQARCAFPARRVV